MSDTRISKLELEPGTIPYTLEQITSPDQYLSDEHVLEYWPIYRAQGNPLRLAKHSAVGAGVTCLVYPEPWSSIRKQNPDITEDYAEELGLVVVNPRSQVGFSDRYRGNWLEGWQKLQLEKGPAVVQVGSFIRFMTEIKTFEVKKRPRGMNKNFVEYFGSLAVHLSGQIDTTETV